MRQSKIGRELGYGGGELGRKREHIGHGDRPREKENWGMEGGRFGMEERADWGIEIAQDRENWGT